MEDLGAKFSKKLRYSICAKDMRTSCSFMSILKSRSGSTLCLIKCKEVRKILHISVKIKSADSVQKALDPVC